MGSPSNIFGFNCCGSSAGGNCTYTVHLQDCGGSPIPDASVRLVFDHGTPDSTGATDEDGNYFYSGSKCPFGVQVTYRGVSYGTPAPGIITITSGGVETSAGSITVMYGEGTVTASVVDYDSGTAVCGPHVNFVQYIGPVVAPDGTGGIPIGYWTFGSGAGCAVPYQPPGTRVPTGHTLADYPFNVQPTGYWAICGIPLNLVYCNDARTLNYRAASKATWNNCCICGTDGDGNRVSAIPHTLHASFNGPPEIFGGDVGVAITLTWDGVSDPGAPVYTSGCRAGNGAWFYCDNGDFPYGSNLVLFSCGSLSYVNYTGPDCTSLSVHDPDYPCGVDSIVSGKPYCADTKLYPLGVSWAGVALVNDNANAAVCAITAPVNIETVNLLDQDQSPSDFHAPDGKGWKSKCTLTYDPSVGQEASATVTE